MKEGILLSEPIILYKGLWGSYLYNCQASDSDKDFVLIMGNLSKREIKIDGTKTPPTEEQLIPIELFQEYIFSTNKNYIKIIGGMGPDAYIEKLFSIPQTEINTPFSKWLIENRQNIINANQSYIGYFLLYLGASIEDKHMLYKISPKIVARAITRTQTYINYAKNPELGFQNALIMPEKCLNLIRRARDGKASNYELFDYLQDLKKEAKQYKNFWDVGPDIDALNRLSLEMMEAVKQSMA